jgi:hypothetical protein
MGFKVSDFVQGFGLFAIAVGIFMIFRQSGVARRGEGPLRRRRRKGHPARAGPTLNDLDQRHSGRRPDSSRDRGADPVSVRRTRQRPERRRQDDRPLDEHAPTNGPTPRRRDGRHGEISRARTAPKTSVAGSWKRGRMGRRYGSGSVLLETPATSLTSGSVVGNGEQ